MVSLILPFELYKMYFKIQRYLDSDCELLSEEDAEQVTEVQAFSLKWLSDFRGHKEKILDKI